MTPEEVAPELLSGVSSLLDKSLLRRQEGMGEGARFSMLSTIRAFALELVRGSEAAADLGHRHARYFLKQAEAARDRLYGSEQTLWLSRVAVDHDNFRAAIAWALQRGETETAARLSGALWQFWLIHGHLSEGRAWAERLMDQPGFDALPMPVLSDVLNSAGVLAGHMGDYAQAMEWLERRLALLRPTRDDRAIAGSLNNLGLLALGQGDTDRAEALFAEGLTLFRRIGFQPGVGLAVHNLGLVASQRKNWVEAESWFEEGLRQSQETGNKRLEAWCLTEIGLAALGRGDLTRALDILSESLAQKRDLADRETVPWTVEGLASLAILQGKADRAARLLAASQALRNELGIPLPPAYLSEFEDDVARASAALGPAGMQVAWLEGSSMSLDDLLAFCLEDSARRPEDSGFDHK
jgi:non-specific serine/threonine protein kinase